MKPSILLCPSATAQSDGANVFAVIGGTPDRPRVNYLDTKIPFDDSLASISGSLDPTEVFRIAGRCSGQQCLHFESNRNACRLVEKVVRLVPSVAVGKVPRCAIRVECRWWEQEGVMACRRCPQIARINPVQGEELRLASDPDVD